MLHNEHALLPRNMLVEQGQGKIRFDLLGQIYSKLVISKLSKKFPYSILCYT